MAVTDIDESKLEAFVGHVATEIGAAVNAALVLIGDELGLFRAMADGQPVSSEELAARTGTQERYVREWLAAQAASGFVELGEDGYVLPPEHALVLADETSPFLMTGVLQSANAAVLARERVAERFVTGEGLGWHEHHHGLFHGVERAAEAGVADRVTFTVAGADEIPGSGYDLVAFFDAFHDLGDPLAAARSAASVLAPDGRCMLVEPLAGARVQDNLHPIGRFYYGMSTLVCTPGSLSQPGRAGLGTQAGEARLREVLQQGGFGAVRRAAETPLNLVLEARLP